MPFKSYSNYSLVTAILPRQSTAEVLEEVLGSGAAHAMSLNARGAIVQERWYQSFLPAISPEQEVLNFLAPVVEVDHLMEQIVMVGKLRRYGVGSIFATPCDNLSCSSDYPLWTPGRYDFESVSFDINFKEDLTVLIHIADRNAADPIARSAIKAGAQGATISYIRGYGLRDRLGLLRITKKHDKELISVVVDKYDADAVFQAMAQTGNVDQPGRGLVYQLPICKGLTNMASVFQKKKHSASVQQMVRAIDDLYGSAEWRANQLLIHDAKAAELESNSKGVSKDLKLLNIIAHRKDIYPLLNSLLENGVSGASVSNWRLAECDGKLTDGGQRINREFGCLSLLLSEEKADAIHRVAQDLIEDFSMRETCIYAYSV
ncbi:MAG: P-II family nitrogen regulator, partial [Verrucomicrobiota bacterium]